MPLRIIENQALLKNNVNSLWYYLAVEIYDGLAFISPGQASVAVPVGNDYSEYALLRANNGTLHEFRLTTQDSQIHYNLIPAASGRSTRLILKGADGVYYEVMLVLFDGQIHATLVSVNVSTQYVCSPLRLVNSAGSTIARALTAAGITCEREITSPTT